MKKYKVTLEVCGSAFVDAKTEFSAFNKGIKLEKKFKKLLKENGFNPSYATCLNFVEVEENE